MSSKKQDHIFITNDSMPQHRREMLRQLGLAVEDNGNTNVLLVHAIAQHVGLSAVEFECWSLISQHGPFTAGELAKRCRITTGGMTGMIDRLERREYVQRRADPNDRRRVLVESVKNKEVEKAMAKGRELYAPLQKAFNALIESYSDDQLAFIIDFMKRTNAMFHEAVNSLPEKQ
ncbi:MAG TPA: MarR family transcriptional regulator [Candidatus Saccharimonadales bacterium]|nr:MarR family transcriptional regulator [Candidatus Saccharimonadales bacterium]